VPAEKKYRLGCKRRVAAGRRGAPTVHLPGRCRACGAHQFVILRTGARVAEQLPDMVCCLCDAVGHITVSPR
jgi:hypothetical protein